MIDRIKVERDAWRVTCDGKDCTNFLIEDGEFELRAKREAINRGWIIVTLANLSTIFLCAQCLKNATEETL